MRAQIRAHIMVVEDGRTQAVRMQSVLEQAGYRVEVCPDGGTAIARFRQSPPDIVLLDMHLPDMNGREVAQRLRAEPFGESVSILFMTAVFREIEDVIGGLNAGADDYLIKPVEDGELIARVQATVRSKENHRQLASTAKQLLAVNRVSRRMAAILESEPLLDFVVESLHKEFGFDHVHVLLLEGADLVVVGGTARHEVPSHLVAEGVVGLTGAALQADQPILDSDPQAEGRAPLVPEAAHALAIPFRSADGGQGAIEVSSVTPLTVGKSDLLVLQTLADVLAVSLHNARLYRSQKEFASRDELTGVHNRRIVLDILENEFGRARRYRRPLAVMVADIDHFKSINDLHGHDVGDEAIRAICDAFKSSIRTHDALGRLGGDEFLLVLPETDPRHAEALAQRLTVRCAEARFHGKGGERLPLTVSLGIAAWPEQDVGAARELVKKADEALYRAKRAGRNRASR